MDYRKLKKKKAIKNADDSTLFDKDLQTRSVINNKNYKGLTKESKLYYLDRAGKLDKARLEKERKDSLQRKLMKKKKLKQGYAEHIIKNYSRTK